MLASLAAASLPTGSAHAGTGELAPYRGLGTWVDLYNWGPWLRPRASVRSMAKHGVQTILIETSSFRFKKAFVRKGALSTILDAAHKRGINVVAWYLAGLEDLPKDLDRIKQTIRFESRGGEKFDAFALNIESRRVKDIAERNRRAVLLSERIKRFAPRSYALGAIVPDPVHQLYWPSFPYREIIRIYDVIVPMSYWSYRGVEAPGDVREYVAANIKSLRRMSGDRRVVMHVPGGIARQTSAVEVRAFARTLKDMNVWGGSLYDFSITTNPQWRELARLRGS